MSVAVTVRGVPEEVRDELAARAARAGKSLQEYLRGMLIDSASRPTVDDVVARARPSRCHRPTRRRRGDPPCSGRRSSMTARVVCDASAVVAMLVDGGPDGRWATGALSRADLVAPGLLFFEAATILRRLEAAERINADQAAQAHADLLDLVIEEWPYHLLARRVWELRRNLTCYDAGYVALAELLGLTLVTLDRRIGRASGPRCAVATP